MATLNRMGPATWLMSTMPTMADWKARPHSGNDMPTSEARPSDTPACVSSVIQMCHECCDAAPASQPPAAEPTNTEAARTTTSSAAKPAEAPSTFRSREAPVRVKKGRKTYGPACCSTWMKRWRCLEVLVHT